MIEITAVRLRGGHQHEHITDVQWRSVSVVGQSSREAIADWLSADSPNRAVVAVCTELVDVAAVRAADGSHYIRTHVSGQWTNDLLWLPTF
jgi:Protein of unknown function (DUF3892)